VNGLREVAGRDPDDPRLRALIDELSAASDRSVSRVAWNLGDDPR
jgi:hypothetical protein